MKEVHTSYGVITDFINLELHAPDRPASLLVMGPTEIETPHGTLVPQYEVEDMGRKEHKHLHFYPSGTLRKLPLQDSHDFETDYGTIPAELVLFHKNGALKKLFPLSGKLSGYWTEENEYMLAEDLTLPLPSNEITAKMISIGFFKSGNIRSITFWPGEVVSMDLPAGHFELRTGISFYETGEVKSLEPLLPTPVQTPIGTVEAFDNDPEGISGDFNSLCFDPEGNVSALTTTSNRVIVTVDSNTRKIYEPMEKESLCSESVKVTVPLHIEFTGDKVRFNKSSMHEYDLAAYSFEIEEYRADLAIPCYNCS